MAAWGRKFEQFVLSDDPTRPPNSLKPVNEKEEFCGIFSYQFGEHNLLYAGEVDGVISDEILNEKSLLTNAFKFCELKTNLFVDCPR
ncbi:decapping nuclease DXO homolog isoform X2 [Belonocnema kinseyi]|uniref:decapping nuclease DXO homolog isoform X2 n=1 Tax=Belonocnema kinseyi TaxID=2817044 RepID=UPI00143DFD22|nr:decapping nuclease DXO homolog isoform X2 [Belonocnema kinseyi]